MKSNFAKKLFIAPRAAAGTALGVVGIASYLGAGQQKTQKFFHK